MVPERNLLIDSLPPAWSRWPFDHFAAMGWEAQDLVSLVVVGLAAVYLVRRGWRYYGSLSRDGRVRCGGCGSCVPASRAEIYPIDRSAPTPTPPALPRTLCGAIPCFASFR